jgi:hypothetical protein
LKRAKFQLSLKGRLHEQLQTCKRFPLLVKIDGEKTMIQGTPNSKQHKLEIIASGDYGNDEVLPIETIKVRRKADLSYEIVSGKQMIDDFLNEIFWDLEMKHDANPRFSC